MENIFNLPQVVAVKEFVCASLKYSSGSAEDYRCNTAPLWTMLQ